MRFQVSCTGNRVADITEETRNIYGDEAHEAENNQNKPSNWVDSILSMKFYKDSQFLNVMDGSTVVVPFGDTVYTKIVADNSYEAINVRVTDCWATETTGYFIKK